MKKSHSNRQYCAARVYNTHNGYRYMCIRYTYRSAVYGAFYYCYYATVVSLSRLLRKSTSGYIRVLPDRGEPPTSAQAHHRRPKNPEFNGKTVVDSWEPYKQDAAKPHCIYKVSLIYLYTLIPITIVRILHTSGTILAIRMGFFHRKAEGIIQNFRKLTSIVCFYM